MGDAFLNLILTNKAELVGVSLGCTNREMVEFRILRGGSKATSRITTLAFRSCLKRTLVSSEICLEESQGRGSWREEQSETAD